MEDKVSWCWDVLRLFTFIVHFALGLLLVPLSDQKVLDPEGDLSALVLILFTCFLSALECKPHEGRAYCLAFSLPYS